MFGKGKTAREQALADLETANEMLAGHAAIRARGNVSASSQATMDQGDAYAKQVRDAAKKILEGGR
jgi:hypothetical protein